MTDHKRLREQIAAAISEVISADLAANGLRAPVSTAEPEQGKCSRCGKRPREDGYSACEPCVSAITLEDLDPPAARTVYDLDVPTHRGLPPLNANQRLHWRAQRPLVRLVRDTVEWRARAANIPACQRITVGLHYQPGDNRRRDASNLMPTQKPAVDALVRAGIVPDDTAEYVTELMPTIHNGPGERRLWLRIVIEETTS